MIDPPQDYTVLLPVLSAVTIASLVLRKKPAPLRIPPMAAYILTGMGLAYADSAPDFVTPSLQKNFAFFAKLGPANDVAAVKEALDPGRRAGPAAGEE